MGTITVNAGEYDRVNTPVSCQVNNLDFSSEQYELQLFEKKLGPEEFVSAQLEMDRDLLWWILAGHTPKRSKRVYELRKVPKRGGDRQVQIEDNGTSLILSDDKKRVLAYQYEEAKVPEGVDHIYSRGGFIHPLWSPNGEVLTRIQPPDHYHHYGIWNPWTRTEFEGEEIDFWNLAKGRATVEVAVRPVGITGDIYGEIASTHSHIVKADSIHMDDRVALRENWKIRAWHTDPDRKIGLVDVYSQLHCATSNPLIIKEYRYQGFGFRARSNWDDQTATLQTSEGLDKATGNASRARWCKIQGPTASGVSGIIFMTHPANFNFPEPIRIWPVGTNEGKENVFFNFNPAQDRDWKLEPGNGYGLRYRMLVFDGEIDSLTTENFWSDFAHPPVATFKRHTTLLGKRVLVYTKNGEGFIHDNISTSIEALRSLGKQHGFQVDVSDDPKLFTKTNLAQYDALVFSNTNNEIFNTSSQREAFQQYIRTGGGFVGIHSASGSERDWPWFWKMLGGKFHRHAPHQSFSVDVVEPNHPSTAHLPLRWETGDECYYLKQLNPDIKILLAADLTTVQDEGKEDYPGDTFGNTFPLAWCHSFDGGRQWYTSLGHDKEHYENPVFIQHILGGILWVVQKE